MIYSNRAEWIEESKENALNIFNRRMDQIRREENDYRVALDAKAKAREITPAEYRSELMVLGSERSPYRIERTNAREGLKRMIGAIIGRASSQRFSAVV